METRERMRGTLKEMGRGDQTSKEGWNRISESRLSTRHFLGLKKSVNAKGPTSTEFPDLGQLTLII